MSDGALTTLAPAADRLDVVGIGEAMLLMQAPPPLTVEEATALQIDVAGAELTVCAAAARFGAKAAFLSAVGTDPPGRRVRKALADNGICDALLFDDTIHPTGVFLRETPHSGERRVTYYRSGSAASALDEHALEQFADRPAPRAIVVSGLTASLGHSPSRLVVRACEQARDNGTAVVLDANLRPQLDTDRALRTIAEILPLVDVLVLGDDESPAVFGAAEPERVRDAAHHLGIDETVLKGGERGCWVLDQAIVHVPALAKRVVDPVGAGDAFLGAYLAGRLEGATQLAAARLASHVAASVVQVPGDLPGLPERAAAGALLDDALAESKL